MEDYFWNTELPLATNAITMSDFIDNHLDELFGSGFEVTLNDGSWIEFANENECWVAQASGNGDFCSHKVQFDKVY